MTEENVELVREGIDAFNRGDVGWILRHLDPEIEWKTASEDPDTATHRGRDAVRHYFEQWMESFSRLRAEFDECFEVSEDRVFATLHFVGQGQASGVDLDWRFSQVYTYRGGTVIRVEEYFDRTEALEAAGLSEQDARGDSP